LGRVKNYPRKMLTRNGSYRTSKSKIMKTYINTRGYVFIRLSKNKKQINARIHRLVADNFIPNLENKPEVNHINGDKTDNRAVNLEWCTKNENMQHAYKNGLLKYCKKVICIETGITYNSIKEAGQKTKINNNDICQCCKGRKKTAGNYHWKYKD
jgi:hypothetical protein